MLDLLPMKERSSALQRAIEATGGLAALAAELGVSMQAVSQWDEVPPLRVIPVERASGVSRHELRPDLYPLDPIEARA
jgi:DNA-binding transcriptional regulator YdaS (Cro superfamily)